MAGLYTGQLPDLTGLSTGLDIGVDMDYVNELLSQPRNVTPTQNQSSFGGPYFYVGAGLKSYAEMSDAERTFMWTQPDVPYSMTPSGDIILYRGGVISTYSNKPRETPKKEPEAQTQLDPLALMLQQQLQMQAQAREQNQYMMELFASMMASQQASLAQQQAQWAAEEKSRQAEIQALEDQKKRRLALAAGGRAGTIKTGSGLGTTPDVTKKTALGS